MWDHKYGKDIEIGCGTDYNPEFMDGVTVQCKNCNWYGESGHCGVMPSERMAPESWCATASPKQFFIAKRKENEII